MNKQVQNLPTKLLLTSIILAQAALADCDPATCQYCCITNKLGQSVCNDEILECKLKNTRSYFSLSILGGIIIFWCAAMPFCLKFTKKLLVGKFCFGYTILGAFEKMVKGLILNSKKKSNITKREGKSVSENFSVLRRKFQKKKQENTEERKKILEENKDKNMYIIRKTYTWKNDKLMFK